MTHGLLRISQVPEKARHYGIATGIPETVDPAEGLVLQYDLKIADGVTCGGAYLKFLTADADIKFEELKDDSPYTVMFGPDKCGSTNKVRHHVRASTTLHPEYSLCTLQSQGTRVHPARALTIAVVLTVLHASPHTESQGHAQGRGCCVLGGCRRWPVHHQASRQQSRIVAAFLQVGRLICGTYC